MTQCHVLMSFDTRLLCRRRRADTAEAVTTSIAIVAGSGIAALVLAPNLRRRAGEIGSPCNVFVWVSTKFRRIVPPCHVVSQLEKHQHALECNINGVAKRSGRFHGPFVHGKSV